MDVDIYITQRIYQHFITYFTLAQISLLECTIEFKWSANDGFPFMQGTYSGACLWVGWAGFLGSLCNYLLFREMLVVGAPGNLGDYVAEYPIELLLFTVLIIPMWIETILYLTNWSKKNFEKQDKWPKWYSICYVITIVLFVIFSFIPALIVMGLCIRDLWVAALP